ncbi:hypothetical protein [Streptomyces sp. NBC_01373]|uniref:hypothetical protein n=1 Tax=Streptomyces sp. NBC_01373 TaxID=2903843 RepID=UPI0022504FFC|nr:hypothetical protein [Streptomyces sp. NBC_01373]MCX4704366.1 hypothetical protein [Streptomyces sp. NBC_01373]MCX4707106.1 hypothetical protein [Streptomyces sp. NBC_01373]
MAEQHEIVDILAGEIAPGITGWSVITLRPDGRRWQHTFPSETFEWRAAEYGLTDPVEILDVILHEPYQDTAPPALPPSVKAAPRGVAKAAADPHGPTLQEATSTAAAQAAHRSRIAAVKEDRVLVTDPDGLLPHIHRNHGMDPDRVRAKQEFVDTHRWTRLYGGLPAEPITKEATRA